MLRLCATIGISLCFHSSVVTAEVLRETHGRVVLDWSNATVQFHGESQLDGANAAKSIKENELSAWRDGLRSLGESMSDLQENRFGQKLASNDGNYSESLRNSTYSTNTVYYNDGHVKVELENALSRVVPKPNFSRQDVDASLSAKNSGIVLRLDKYSQPKAVFQVFDESGQQVYGLSDVAQNAFQKNLMGRWYKASVDPSADIGKEPASLDAKIDDSGRITVNKADWQKATEGNQALLQGAKVALVVP